MRIIFQGDRLWGTSAYSKIIYNLSMRLLKEGHQVAHIPMTRSLKGGPFDQNGVLVYPSGMDPFSQDVAVEHYLHFNADMLITVKEPWVFSTLHKEAINFVPMAIIDHSPVSASITSRLHTAFKVIAVSRFGQSELRKNKIDSTYIPHGIPEVYRRLSEEKRKACRKMFALDPDEFVVGIVAMNRSRKLISRQILGYKRFLELNPDAKSHLFLWTDLQPSRGMDEPTTGISDVGVSLLPEIMELGMGESIKWPDRKNVADGIPEWDGENYVDGWDMVKLYNSFSVNMLCTGGEGAGLPYIEAAACGVASICTDYAAAPEYVGPGLTVPAKEYVILNAPGTRYALPSIDGMADALTKLYNTDREKLARKLTRHAERYAWDRILDRYVNPFMDECEKELFPLYTSTGLKSWRQNE
ncbi:hypothetical protein LCGC14_1259440 [marine sediment metagenome]|uniref:Glycosyl transferase family 1 domain-containing protein n=1 Tax=marine sediment metagenome TaxID=412755 RepID=A0A0F9P4J9_9ZZZZ